MPKKSSGTAHSVYKLICALSKKEQNDLAMILMKDRETLVGIAFEVVISKLGKIHERMSRFANEADSFEEKLMKHRKPRKNGERDNEIMKLHAQKKTAGQIIMVLSSKYPKLTDKMINAVIWRQRHGS